LALCEFGCEYCSSNWGNYLRIRREQFAELTEAQLGKRTYPDNDPDLIFIWPDILTHLHRQLEKKPPNWGAGRTLVFSMLTDGFSPLLVQEKTTEAALQMLIERTSFRIRVLTKNAVVGTEKWITFFKGHPNRFVIGLSTGTLGDEWAKRVEIKTSIPSARLRALANLQDAGIPTYGILCPVFPDVLDDGLRN
jgi:DNA repair photolyase